MIFLVDLTTFRVTQETYLCVESTHPKNQHRGHSKNGHAELMLGVARAMTTHILVVPALSSRWGAAATPGGPCPQARPQPQEPRQGDTAADPENCQGYREATGKGPVQCRGPGTPARPG